MPSFQFSVLKTKTDSYVMTNRTCERFFGGRLNLARSKDDGPRGARYCCSFNAPSTYASMVTARRLVSTVRVHGFSSDPFKKHLSNRSGFDLKTVLTKNTRVTFQILRGARGLRPHNTS
jgi:hypothetical protein